MNLRCLLLILVLHLLLACNQQASSPVTTAAANHVATPTWKCPACPYILSSNNDQAQTVCPRCGHKGLIKSP